MKGDRELLAAALEQIEHPQQGLTYLDCNERQALKRLVRSELNGTRYRAHGNGLRNGNLDAMTLAEKVEHLSFCLEELTGQAYRNEPKGYEEFRGKGFTPQQARLMAFIHSKKGEVATVNQIMAAVFWDRSSDDWPEENILKVIVSNCRRKLRKNGEPGPVCVWGVGYHLGEI